MFQGTYLYIQTKSQKYPLHYKSTSVNITKFPPKIAINEILFKPTPTANKILCRILYDAQFCQTRKCLWKSVQHFPKLQPSL